MYNITFVSIVATLLEIRAHILPYYGDIELILAIIAAFPILLGIRRYLPKVLTSKHPTPETVEITQVLPNQKRIFMSSEPDENFVSREELESEIRSLLVDSKDVNDKIIIALCGAGGFGKTTLAKAICRDDDVKRKFFEGIHWVTLGENPDIIEKIKDMIFNLTQENSGLTTIDSARAHLMEIIDNKYILLVIDDLWNEADLNHFLHIGKNCALLITTRENDILPSNARKISVSSMGDDESIELLKRGLPLIEDEVLMELAKKLGRWPLLLKLVNGTLRLRINELNSSVGQAIDYVNKALKEDLTSFDSRNPKERHQAVDVTVNISIKHLSEEDKNRCFELSIFPKNTDIPVKTLESLWNKTGNLNPLHVDKLCTKLYNMSLLDSYNVNTKTLKLHDIIRCYLLNKQKATISSIHAEFLDAYKIEQWSELPSEETYLWEYLAYHLVEAKREEVLKSLLLDFNWQQAKLNATDIHFLIKDYDFFPKDSLINCVQGALKLSTNALSIDKKQLSSQFLGRLKYFSETELQSIMKEATKAKSFPFLHPMNSNLMPPGGSLIRTLRGYNLKKGIDDWIWGVAVTDTEDSKYAISACGDTTLKLWERNTGKLIRILEGHEGRVRSVSITKDGKYAISASDDSTLKIWSIKTGKEIRTPINHPYVRAVTVTPDGKYAVSASYDSTLKVWEIETGREKHNLKGHLYGVWGVAVTEDGKYAVSASDDKTLKIWEIETGRLLRTLKGHSGWVRSVAITYNKKYVISGSLDKTLKVWDFETGQEIRSLEGHSGWIRSVAVMKDGRYAVSASEDNTLKIWEIETGKEVRTLKGHFHPVRGVAVTQDGDVVSASVDSTLKVWSIKPERKDIPQKGHCDLIRSIAITKNGKYAISASDDKMIKIWNIETGQEIRTLKGHSNSVFGVAVTDNERYIISASEDKTLKLWNFDKGGEPRTLVGHTDWVWSVAVTEDGKAISASDDKTLKVWEIETGELIRTLEGHTGWIRSVAVTQNGKYAISASQDHTIKIWDIEKGKEVKTLIGHTGWVWSVAVTPDGKWAVSASNDNTIRVWNLNLRKEEKVLNGNFEHIKSVALTPDGNNVILASRDSSLKIWNINEDKEIVGFTGDTGLYACNITPDCNYVAVGDDSGAIHFLKLQRAVN